MSPNLVIAPSRLFVARRRALSLSGAVLSAGAVALLGGRDAMAAGKKATAAELEGDVRILNSALGAELEAIAAVQFQGHHKEHADALAATVKKLGGTPVAAKPKYAFPTDKLKNQNDVLRFAAGLEKGAISAYLGAVPLFTDRALSQVAASILGDEAMHWAVLRQVLGESPAVPSAFMS